MASVYYVHHLQPSLAWLFGLCVGILCLAFPLAGFVATLPGSLQLVSNLIRVCRMRQKAELVVFMWSLKNRQHLGAPSDADLHTNLQALGYTATGRESRAELVDRTREGHVLRVVHSMAAAPAVMTGYSLVAWALASFEGQENPSGRPSRQLPAETERQMRDLQLHIRGQAPAMWYLTPAWLVRLAHWIAGATPAPAQRVAGQSNAPAPGAAGGSIQGSQARDEATAAGSAAAADHSAPANEEAGTSAGAGATAAARMVSTRRCAQCGGQTAAGFKLKKCALCLQVRYCSADCQRAHWRAGHKEACPGGRGTSGSG